MLDGTDLTKDKDRTEDRTEDAVPEKKKEPSRSDCSHKYRLTNKQ